MKTNIHASGRKTLRVLNDLIRINIDRITALEKAAHEEQTPDPQLRDAFYRMAIEGRSNVNDLHAKVIRLGGAPVTHATITGKLYLHWLEAHPNFEGPDNSSRLAACIAAGHATEEAYHHALDEQLPQELHELIENQLWTFERTQQNLAQLATHA
jgi:uncharacterized protein (TIGR02284 family)